MATLDRPSYQTRQPCSPNVLVFSETGVGKSSVINLIAGQPLAGVSAGVSLGTTGCTTEAAPYDVVLTDSQGLGHHLCLFDTVGLNEPSFSKIDYLTAIEKAYVLITELQRTGGIHLLVFCVRGDKITDVTQSNYRLFCNILCQNQAPVALVVTGMENEHPMKNWWTKNTALLEQYNFFKLCTLHACVTATRGLNGNYAGQYQDSQDVIHEMLLTHLSGTSSWKPGRTGWFGELLKWVGKIWDSRRHLPEQPSALTVGELALHLEDRCNLSREEAVESAGKICAKRMENA